MPMAQNYNEAFENLSPMTGFRSKAPHKAILLLSVIELIENGHIVENEIKYDDVLHYTFDALWSKYVTNTYYTPELCRPFWELTRDRFWRVFPNWRKEELYDDLTNNINRNSDELLRECVDYAELDYDLYFILTMSSGRRGLKRSLLKAHFQLSDAKIESILTYGHNVIIFKGDDLPTTDYKNESLDRPVLSNHGKSHGLSLDVVIELNLYFYSFLKNNNYVRDELVDLCPDAMTFFEKIVNEPRAFKSCSSSLKYELSSSLGDLKIALMGYNDSLQAIEGIETTLSVLNDEDLETTDPESSFSSSGESEMIEKVESVRQEMIELERPEETVDVVVPIPQIPQPALPEFDFVPKGCMADITTYISSCFDYFWMLSLIDLVNLKEESVSFDYAEIGIMIIANAWVILSENEELADKTQGLNKCIEYIKRMNQIIIGSDNPNRYELYQILKSSPIDQKVNTAIDIITADSSFNILKAWFKIDDKKEICSKAYFYSKNCLYSINPRKSNPYITINSSWKRYLRKENADLRKYYLINLLDYLRTH